MNERGCYCDLWEKNPESLIAQGIPRGYCGICIRCGKPGHLRQAPGATPVTLAWCDGCYRRATMFLWLRVVIFAIVFAGIVALLAKWMI
jgi:hypothetical protein